MASDTHLRAPELGRRRSHLKSVRIRYTPKYIPGSIGSSITRAVAEVIASPYDGSLSEIRENSPRHIATG